MPHRRLSDTGSDSGHAQHRAKCVPQGVNVDRAASVVTLRDAGRFLVAVENLAERLRDVEQRC